MAGIQTDTTEQCDCTMGEPKNEEKELSGMLDFIIIYMKVKSMDSEFAGKLFRHPVIM